MQVDAVTADYPPDLPLAEWLPAVLKFVPGPGLDELRRRYTMLLADQLGARIGILTSSDREAGTRLAHRMSELPHSAFLRILVAPESVHRLLWPELHEPAEIALFFERSVEAERILSGLDSQLDQPGWTCLGDLWCGSVSTLKVLKLEDFPPLVLGDPQARHPLAAPPSSEADDQLSDASLELMIERLTEVRQKLQDTDHALWAFARDLNTTLVLRRSGAEQTGFRSSSPERYVGRSILWNPDLADVTVADLAEALIHEGIHTVLDSTDALISRVTPAGTRWVTDPDLYDGVSRTVSPWTGRRLDVPTYVHGFLVWFGLLCFWSRALLSKAFDIRTARQRMIRAGAPFMYQTALTPLEPFAGVVRSDLLQLLRSMQAEVNDEFQEIVG